MTKKSPAIAALTLLCAACSNVAEQRVETGLVEAGVPQGLASCMATDWADKLSVDQIREIARLAETVRAEQETLTVPRLIMHVRSWNDLEALAVVTSSATRCAFQ